MFKVNYKTYDKKLNILFDANSNKADLGNIIACALFSLETHVFTWGYVRTLNDYLLILPYVLKLT